jgi:hypothetical protein
MSGTSSARRVTNKPSGGEPAKVVVEEARLVRFTLYTSPKKEFAVRYLALKKHKSVNKLINEHLDALLQKEGIDPESLPDSLP